MSKPKTAQQGNQVTTGRIVVFPNWCKGCDLCIEFCPQGVLEHRPGINVLVTHPEKCTGCRWCELHCPDFAIFIKGVEPGEEEE